jgi:RNA polymerase sigma factor (sigma-70 family)
MRDKDDFELLAEYAAGGSERAFATLTERYVNLVYSAALRQLSNPQLAEEVAQAVFLILSKKTGDFRKGTVLSGWLLRTTRFTTTNILVHQYRRTRREQEAAQMHNTPSDESAWDEMVPFLDEAMSQLGEKDRNAIALRYFEQKPLEEVGLAVGALSANAVQSAPVGLVGVIAAATLVKGSTAASATVPALIKSTLQLMAWEKTKTAAASAGMALLASNCSGRF